MAQTYIALFRGINVGKAKRIAMADLRAWLTDLGYGNPQTLLNSGNAVFTASGPTAAVARKIEGLIEREAGFFVRTTVVTAAEFSAVVRKNPLPQCNLDPTRFLVAFFATPASHLALGSLASADWGEDVMVLTKEAAYLWCATGILDSPLSKAFAKVGRDEVTARNWATVLKLQELVLNH